MLLQGSRIERVEIFGLGLAQHLSAVGVDEIEVPDHPLCRMRDRLVIETPVASVLARFPGEIQFLAFFLEKLSGVDPGHLVEYLPINRIAKNQGLLLLPGSSGTSPQVRSGKRVTRVNACVNVDGPFAVTTSDLSIQIALIRNSLNGIRTLAFIFLLAPDQLAIEFINKIVYGSVHIRA